MPHLTFQTKETRKHTEITPQALFNLSCQFPLLPFIVTYEKMWRKICFIAPRVTYEHLSNYFGQRKMMSSKKTKYCSVAQITGQTTRQ